MSDDHKAYLEVEEGDRITCRFNPADFSLSKRNQWEDYDVPGRDAPDLYYTGGGSGSMSLELTFDTTDDGTAVTKHTNALLGAMKINPSLPDYDPERNMGRPPWVKFHWGEFHSFRAVIESLDLRFTYFSSTGVPLRATASLSLTQYEDESWEPQNPTSGTPLPHRVHQFQLGDTLDRLAARYYGDSTRWRQIARANAIVDPLGIEPGTLLVIPKQPGALGA